MGPDKGVKGDKENVSFFNNKAVGGSLTMTSVKLEEHLNKMVEL
jgi:hypothetical protein